MEQNEDSLWISIEDLQKEADQFPDAQYESQYYPVNTEQEFNPYKLVKGKLMELGSTRGQSAFEVEDKVLTGQFRRILVESPAPVLTQEERKLIDGLEKHIGNGPGFVTKLVAIIRRLEAELQKQADKIPQS